MFPKVDWKKYEVTIPRRQIDIEFGLNFLPNFFGCSRRKIGIFQNG